jgi:hypothetical protein
MVAGRQPLKKSRGAIPCAAVVFLFFATTLAAETGDSTPQLLSTKGGKNGIRWSNTAELKKAAEASDPKACAQYGEALLNGDGVTKDTAQAMLYLRLGADSGEPNAAFRLGKIYDDGELTPKDYAKAFDYYSTAAKAGIAEAQYNLGVMYVSAHGVPRDYVEGLAWFIVATKNGAPPDAEKQVRERLQKTKRQQQIAAAEQRAVEILKNPSTVTVPGGEAKRAATPQKPQAPAKIDLDGATAPAKIVVTPPAAPTPDLGKNVGNELLSIHVQSPAESENKVSPPKKSP